MEENSRTLEHASFELDSTYHSQFSMLNDAIFTDRTGINFVVLDCVRDDKGENADWTIVIQQGQKMSDVMDRVPFGILNKTITGLGATTLEITNQERNSIIVVPTKSLAYSKCKSENLHKGGEYALYIGSPIKDITSNVSPQKIQAYLNNNSIWKKKFLVVADSLPFLIQCLENNHIDIYNEYFLMVDEIDTMQADSAYRPRLENVMDYYFKFDRKHRNCVSATLNDFSNPELENESRVTTRWKENPQRNIDLIHTNYVDDVAVEIIKQKLANGQDDKIIIAYNSLDGILNILELLRKENLEDMDGSNVGILCSERSHDKIKEYLEDTDNVINEEAYLQKKIVFMTCAYFAGIDIKNKCHLVTISSHLQPFTYLSTQRMTQIAGRCREGNLSETIIYDTPTNPPVNEGMDKIKYQSSLIKQAEAYANFLNTAKEAVESNPELHELTHFIDSFVQFSAKASVTDSKYPIKIVRQNCITKRFAPAYFNIDALVEKWQLAYSLYSEKKNLYEELVKQNHKVNKIDRYISREQHDSSSIAEIKERNKERRMEAIEELKPKLLEWNKNGRDEILYQEIYRSQEKQIQNLCVEFKKLSLYMDGEKIFDDLSDKYKDGRMLRNYVNAAIFHAMRDDHAFKADVLAKFNYHDIRHNLGARGIGKVSQRDKLYKLKEVFRVQLKKTDIADDSLAEYFSCFFKVSRSGGKNKIIGLNPLDLPTPIQYIDRDANLLELFIFPQA